MRVCSIKKVYGELWISLPVLKYTLKQWLFIEQASLVKNCYLESLVLYSTSPGMKIWSLCLMGRVYKVGQLASDIIALSHLNVLDCCVKLGWECWSTWSPSPSCRPCLPDLRRLHLRRWRVSVCRRRRCLLHLHNHPCTHTLRRLLLLHPCTLSPPRRLLTLLVRRPPATEVPLLLRITDIRRIAELTTTRWWWTNARSTMRRFATQPNR